MSKNVAIKEGSTSKQFGNAKKLRTNLVGGGTADWVPEDEVQLTSLHITEDGTYNANDEGYYGYNPVTVSGIGSCTFTAEEGDFLNGEPLVPGNEYSHDPDDEEDPVKVLPSYIVIEKEPDITEYHDLDPIILTDMEVKAYSNDDVIWTDEEWENDYIPLDKIIFEPIKADASKSQDTSFESDLDTSPFTQPIYAYKQIVVPNYRVNDALGYCDFTITAEADSYLIAVKESNTWAAVYAVSATNTVNATVNRYSRNTGHTDIIPISGHTSHGANIQTATFYDMVSYYREVCPFVVVNYDTTDIFIDVGASLPSVPAVPWTIAHGTKLGGGQTIAVKWYRPDGEELTTSFNITVTPNALSDDYI